MDVLWRVVATQYNNLTFDVLQFQFDKGNETVIKSTHSEKVAISQKVVPGPKNTEKTMLFLVCIKYSWLSLLLETTLFLGHMY